MRQNDQNGDKAKPTRTPKAKLHLLTSALSRLYMTAILQPDCKLRSTDCKLLDEVAKASCPLCLSNSAECENQKLKTIFIISIHTGNKNPSSSHHDDDNNHCPSHFHNSAITSVLPGHLPFYNRINTSSKCDHVCHVPKGSQETGLQPPSTPISIFQQKGTQVIFPKAEGPSTLHLVKLLRCHLPLTPFSAGAQCTRTGPGSSASVKPESKPATSS